MAQTLALRFFPEFDVLHLRLCPKLLSLPGTQPWKSDASASSSTPHCGPTQAAFIPPCADSLNLIQRRCRTAFVGQCYFDDMARTYSAARIAFNRSIRNDVNMRVFEAVACGSMPMTNDLSDNGLDALFRDGVHLASDLPGCRRPARKAGVSSRARDASGVTPLCITSGVERSSAAASMHVRCVRENHRRFLEKWPGNGCGDTPHPASGRPLPPGLSQKGRGGRLCPPRAGRGQFPADFAPDGGLRLRLDLPHPRLRACCNRTSRQESTNPVLGRVGRAVSFGMEPMPPGQTESGIAQSGLFDYRNGLQRSLARRSHSRMRCSMTIRPLAAAVSDQETAEATNRNRVSGIGRVPIIVAGCLICLIAAINLVRLTCATAPRNPWESLEVVEAWRSLRGMPVYELPPAGHATHNYGALVPWVQGQIFRWTGPNNVTGRLLSVSSALLLVTLLAFCCKGEHSAWALAIAWAALLGVDHRSGNYFAENRPDMTALFLGAAAVVLLGLGVERRRWAMVVLGTACLVLGFFFKQTVSIFSAVPTFALLIRWRRPARTEIALAALPLLVMASVILSLRFFSPAVHYYMIAVQGSYAINWPRAAKFLWELLLDSPLFLVVLAEMVFFGEGLRRAGSLARAGCWRFWRSPFRFPSSPSPSSAAGPTACCPHCWR